MVIRITDAEYFSKINRTAGAQKKIAPDNGGSIIDSILQYKNRELYVAPTIALQKTSPSPSACNTKPRLRAGKMGRYE